MLFQLFSRTSLLERWLANIAFMLTFTTWTPNSTQCLKQVYQVVQLDKSAARFGFDINSWDWTSIFLQTKEYFLSYFSNIKVLKFHCETSEFSKYCQVLFLLIIIKVYNHLPLFTLIFRDPFQLFLYLATFGLSHL